jgi:O-antigen/teichoic acid export membrane protein
VLVFIKPIVQLYGNQFDSNLEQLVIIASCTSFFISLINVYNQLFLSKGRNWFIFWSRFVRDLVVLMFFIVFIKDYKSSSILMSNLNLYSAIIYLFVLIFVQFKLEKAGRVSKINT